jgi:hypothetical protein
MIYVLYPFVTYLLTVPGISNGSGPKSRSVRQAGRGKVAPQAQNTGTPSWRSEISRGYRSNATMIKSQCETEELTFLSALVLSFERQKSF